MMNLLRLFSVTDTLENYCKVLFLEFMQHPKIYIYIFLYMYIYGFSFGLYLTDTAVHFRVLSNMFF